MTSQNSNLGMEGEGKAVVFLQEKGYTILEQNYATKFGEIDIIAQETDTIVFVEVKARSTYSFGGPEEQIPWQKQQRITKIALTYLKKNHLEDKPIRFDVVTISPDNTIELIKNAFDAGGN
ncbi:MAG: YraN family protein [bacterium]